MKLLDLKKEIEQYQYFEDTNIIDVSLASIISTRMKLGEPIWLIIIGPSSGGKSQILRPLALTDPKFLHRIDDLTENTFLSGANLGAGKGSPSLLTRIGSHGMLVVSDFTVIFSKSEEVRATILSQFRMIYDGEMNKSSGSSDKPISWKGSLGVIAGSTPSIYAKFEEVSDMGERFIYYRMKDYDAEKATRLAMSRKMYGKALDDKLSTLYADYMKEVIVANKDTVITLSDETNERILQISLFAERVRTTAHLTFRTQEMDRIPCSAMPMRVAQQLTAMANGLALIRNYESGDMKLTENDHSMLEWCGYSLANEEKRHCLKALAQTKYGEYTKTSVIADVIGLSTTITRSILQNLAAVNVIVRSGDGESLSWRIKKESEWTIVRRVEKIDEIIEHQDRLITDEEGEEKSESLDKDFEKQW